MYNYFSFIKSTLIESKFSALMQFLIAIFTIFNDLKNRVKCPNEVISDILYNRIYIDLSIQAFFIYIRAIQTWTPSNTLLLLILNKLISISA